VSEPDLTPLYGCAAPWQQHAIEGSPGAKHGALWPLYLCRCESCGVTFTWCGAHYESGAHYTCEGCCGYPFCMCLHRHTGRCPTEERG
jgi:hypothetical protein